MYFNLFFCYNVVREQNTEFKWNIVQFTCKTFENKFPKIRKLNDIKPVNDLLQNSHTAKQFVNNDNDYDYTTVQKKTQMKQKIDLIMMPSASSHDQWCHSTNFKIHNFSRLNHHFVEWYKLNIK